MTSFDANAVTPPDIRGLTNGWGANIRGNTTTTTKFASALGRYYSDSHFLHSIPRYLLQPAGFAPLRCLALSPRHS